MLILIKRLLQQVYGFPQHIINNIMGFSKCLLTCQTKEIVIPHNMQAPLPLTSPELIRIRFLFDLNELKMVTETFYHLLQ